MADEDKAKAEKLAAAKKRVRATPHTTSPFPSLFHLDLQTSTDFSHRWNN